MARFHALVSGSASSKAQNAARTIGCEKESRFIGSEPEIDEGLERDANRARNRQHIDGHQRRDSDCSQPGLTLIGADQGQIEWRRRQQRNESAEQQREWY